MGIFSRDEYCVHFKYDGEDKKEGYPTYEKALARKAELNSKKIYAYIKKE